MRTRQEGQSSSDDEHDERAPLVARHPPPPPPPAQGQAAMPPPPPRPAVPSPQHRSQMHVPGQPSPQQRNPPRNVGLPPLRAPPLPPPPFPPPHPPPPPPPPPAICASDWILKLRHPGRGMLRIHVPKGMTAYLLSRCIVQATDLGEDSVVGLFGYNNGMFVSLEHLLSCSDEDALMLHKQVYSLGIPQPLPRPPWWQDWRILLGTFALVLALVWQHSPLLLHAISGIPGVLEDVWDQISYYLPLFYHSLVTKPLKDTYRFGPTVFGGWEGADLEDICARMTYGDREFWERNYADCETMYLAKESAFLFIGRPLVFLVLLLIAVWILRQWMWYHALQDRERYQDRDMIMTYRAIQTLFRQMNRMGRVADDRGRRPQLQGRDDYPNGRNY